ncbi:MAG: UDP-N-acetylglucosamine 2-epimerase (non-hydrolyzing) [Acidobacteriia bacterium]|nr:UDP-N-acetylglucosamine 2-epimerase (non-hydrolyzing) [Terriglobia bacterium]
MLKIVNVAGARPNFVKIGPIIAELRKHPDSFFATLVHTGQHYDDTMSDSFFRDLEIPRPDISLNVGSGSHAQQTAEIMRRFEPVLLDLKPDYVLVVGDVNSTIACALTAAKLQSGVIHVEAGLRSFDREMPEEVNRVLTDHVADLLFVTEESGRRNLLNEGIAEDRIHLVGNVMIDSLQRQLAAAGRSGILSRLGLAPERYGLVTLHRPSNVDKLEVFPGILSSLAAISRNLPVVFPIHPRTEARLAEWKLDKFFANSGAEIGSEEKWHGLYRTPPLGYLDFLQLMRNARLVLTDSGGIQEETTVLGVPCLTLRNNTERPSTIYIGTNRLVGNDPRDIEPAVAQVLATPKPTASLPPFWDGHTASRIVEVLLGIEKQRCSGVAPGK